MELGMVFAGELPPYKARILLILALQAEIHLDEVAGIFEGLHTIL